MGATGPRVSPLILPHTYIYIKVLEMDVYDYWLSCREREVHLETEVKSGLMGCRDLKVVQVLQDQMDQRYYTNTVL